MTTAEAKARSAEKVKQIKDLMKVLHIMPVCKEKVVPGGFIEKVVIFQDFENYDISDAEEQKQNDAPLNQETNGTSN